MAKRDYNTFKGIRPEHMALEIHKQLKEYTEDVKESVWDTAMNVSENAVLKLQAESPKRKEGGEYARNWTRSTDRKGVIIHNKAPTYRLTHLLEKGHQLKRGGRKIGADVPAHPHITKVEKECIDEYVAEVERRLRG